MTFPTWYRLIAVSVCELADVAGVPTMNSCPTRWARLMSASTLVAVRVVAAAAGASPTASEVAVMPAVRLTAARTAVVARRGLDNPGSAPWAADSHGRDGRWDGRGGGDLGAVRSPMSMLRRSAGTGGHNL